MPLSVGPHWPGVRPRNRSGRQGPRRRSIQVQVVLAQARATKPLWSPRLYARLAHCFLTSFPFCLYEHQSYLRRREKLRCNGRGSSRQHAFTTIPRLTSQIPNYSHSFICVLDPSYQFLILWKLFQKLLGTGYTIIRLRHQDEYICYNDPD